MKTLDIRTVFEMRSDALPVFCAILLHEHRQLLVFFGVPIPFGVMHLLKRVYPHLLFSRFVFRFFLLRTAQNGFLLEF
jgi:hypothetical protein